MILSGGDDIIALEDGAATKDRVSQQREMVLQQRGMVLQQPIHSEL